MVEGLADKLATLPRQRGQALPALHVLHDHAGYLEIEGLEEIAAWLHIPKSELYAVAASYTEFEMAPPPQDAVYVCRGLSCQIAGSAELASDLAATGREVVERECMFACAVAPVVRVDGSVVGRATNKALA